MHGRIAHRLNRKKVLWIWWFSDTALSQGTLLVRVLSICRYHGVTRGNGFLNCPITTPCLGFYQEGIQNNPSMAPVTYAKFFARLVRSLAHRRLMVGSLGHWRRDQAPTGWVSQDFDFQDSGHEADHQDGSHWGN
jgi:hypothetical protein